MVGGISSLLLLIWAPGNTIPSPCPLCSPIPPPGGGGGAGFLLLLVPWSLTCLVDSLNTESAGL